MEVHLQLISITVEFRVHYFIFIFIQVHKLQFFQPYYTCKSVSKFANVIFNGESSRVLDRTQSHGDKWQGSL